MTAIAPVLSITPAFPAAQPSMVAIGFEALLSQAAPLSPGSALPQMPVFNQAFALELPSPTLPQLPAIDLAVAAVVDGLPANTGEAVKIAPPMPAAELPQAVFASPPKAIGSVGKGSSTAAPEDEQGNPLSSPIFPAPPVPPASTKAQPDVQPASELQNAQDQAASNNAAPQPLVCALQIQPVVAPMPISVTAGLQQMTGLAARPAQVQAAAASRTFITAARSNAQPVGTQSAKTALPAPVTALPETIAADLIQTRTVTESPVAPLPTPIQSAPALAVSPVPTAEAVMHPPQLDLISDTTWIDQLARDISASAAGEGKLRFRLMPEFLGELDVTLTHRQDAIDVSMQAGSETAARIIAAEQPRVIEDLRQFGLRVGNFETTSGQQNQNPRQQGTQPQQQPTLEQFKSQPSPKRNGRFA